MKPERNRPYDQPADHVFIIHTLVYSQDEHDCGDRQQLQIALAAPHGMNVPWYEWEGNVQHLIEDHGIPGGRQKRRAQPTRTQHISSSRTAPGDRRGGHRVRPRNSHHPQVRRGPPQRRCRDNHSRRRLHESQGRRNPAGRSQHSHGHVGYAQKPGIRRPDDPGPSRPAGLNPRKQDIRDGRQVPASRCVPGRPAHVPRPWR